MRLSAYAFVCLPCLLLVNNDVSVVRAADGGAAVLSTPPPGDDKQSQPVEGARTDRKAGPGDRKAGPGITGGLLGSVVDMNGVAEDTRPFIKWNGKLENTPHDFALFKSKFRQFTFKNGRRPGEVFEMLDINSDGKLDAQKELVELKTWVVDTGVRVPHNDL